MSKTGKKRIGGLENFPASFLSRYCCDGQQQPTRVVTSTIDHVQLVVRCPDRVECDSGRRHPIGRVSLSQLHQHSSCGSSNLLFSVYLTYREIFKLDKYRSFT